MPGLGQILESIMLFGGMGDRITCGERLEFVVFKLKASALLLLNKIRVRGHHRWRVWKHII